MDIFYIFIFSFITRYLIPLYLTRYIIVYLLWLLIQQKKHTHTHIYIEIYIPHLIITLCLIYFIFPPSLSLFRASKKKTTSASKSKVAKSRSPSLTRSKRKNSQSRLLIEDLNATRDESQEMRNSIKKMKAIQQQ